MPVPVAVAILTLIAVLCLSYLTAPAASHCQSQTILTTTQCHLELTR